MRFTADYDSEEEEFSVDDAKHEPSSKGTHTHNFPLSSSEDEEDEFYMEPQLFLKAKNEAWVPLA
jgi:hypothetical protein